MPEDHTGHGFNLNIQHRVALRLREVAHLFLGKLDVSQLTRRQRGDQRRDLCLTQPEGGGGVIVKLL